MPRAMPIPWRAFRVRPTRRAEPDAAMVGSEAVPSSSGADPGDATAAISVQARARSKVGAALARCFGPFPGRRSGYCNARRLISTVLIFLERYGNTRLIKILHWGLTQDAVQTYKHKSVV
jgi:hypothetical protein